MRSNIKLLGWIYIVWSAMGMLGGLTALIAFGLFGGLFASVTGPHSHAALPIFTGLGMIVFMTTAVLSLPGLLVGWGLITFQSWARIGGIVMSILNLTAFPFGTIVGVFGLMTLCDSQAIAVFEHS
jgi:hypothetical protein